MLDNVVPNLRTLERNITEALSGRTEDTFVFFVGEEPNECRDGLDFDQGLAKLARSSCNIGQDHECFDADLQELGGRSY